jgi:hypothetical protein
MNGYSYLFSSDTNQQIVFDPFNSYSDSNFILNFSKLVSPLPVLDSEVIQLGQRLPTVLKFYENGKDIITHILSALDKQKVLDLDSQVSAQERFQRITRTFLNLRKDNHSIN